MWVLKQCTCGSTDFENEDDTIRCEKCGRLASYKFIDEVKENDANEM